VASSPAFPPFSSGAYAIEEVIIEPPPGWGILDSPRVKPRGFIEQTTTPPCPYPHPYHAYHYTW